MTEVKTFQYDGVSRAVTYIETTTVKEGVECDVYSFDNDASHDLAIVRVQPGHTTPLQKVVSGDKTIEGFLSGKGWLTVDREHATVYEFPNQTNMPVEIVVGATMQWAAGDTGLEFFEICYPPYSQGRFENLSDE